MGVEKPIGTTVGVIKMIGNIPIIDKDLDTEGWYYCQETDEIFYHDGKSLRESIPTTKILVVNEDK